MLQKDNRSKILGLFFDDPLPKGIGFQLREISRKVSIAPLSVKKYLGELEKEGFVTHIKHRIHNYPVYYANRENEKFIFFKKVNNTIKLFESGILDYLLERCIPDAIVLFGSASKGEDTKDSDIDLFVLAKEDGLELHKFEKRLNRRINIFFSDDFNSLSKELKNNIINGVLLKGYLKIF